MPFPNEKFDIVICLGVFQTVTAPDKALLETNRVLKRGGVLIIRTLNDLSLSSFWAKKNNPNFTFYNPFLFKKELNNKGFQSIRLKGTYFFPPSLSFFTELLFKIRLYKILNLFFPIFVLFSHSFYIDGIKR